MTRLRTDLVEILVAARQRIEGHFTKGSYAMVGDRPISLFYGLDAPVAGKVGSADTCDVCSYGALYWAAFGYPAPSVFDRLPDPWADVDEAFAAADQVAWALTLVVRERSVQRTLAAFNDAADTTEADVLAVFDRAIEMAANGADPFHRKDEAGTP